MKKKLCDHCIGTCDTPDSHCSIRLHMSCTTLSELLRLLEFSKRHLNLMIQLKLTDDDFISDYFNCANYWYEHLSKILIDYGNTHSRSKNGRKFIVDRIHGYLR